MITLIRWTAVFAILGVLSVASYWLASSRTLAGDVKRLEAELTPVDLDLLQGGDADWRELDEGAERISVEVEDITPNAGLNLGVGTDLEVTLQDNTANGASCSGSLGTIDLGNIAPAGAPVILGGDLDLDERDFQPVPTCDVGDGVTVKRTVADGGATILTGTFVLDD